jgi:putative Mg2+ transporter-C (MgtC) family protein
MAFSEWTVVWRILVATALAYAIGLEREWRGAPAGDRTFALVAVGASSVTAIGVEAFPASAEKVIAGVVTGVGFLGAGLIFRSPQGVVGLTTAAAAWAVAGMSVLMGTGALWVALVVGALILLILEMDRLPLLRRMHQAAERHRPPEGPPPDGAT